MKTKRNRKRIRRNDYERILVTETLPNEVPIVFSNEGFYKSLKTRASNSTLRNRILDDFLCKESKDWAKPYAYKIRKNASEFRRLGLVHPREQWLWVDFYRRHDERILELCNVSQMSIRSPKKVASTFYTPSDLNIDNIIKGNIEATEEERFLEYSTSYFAYRGYLRLYQLYASTEFMTLEKQFAHLRTLDVARCFDSIYTHTIAWAATSKEFTKRNLKRASFSKEFDRRMQYSNDGETNGIIIGPEISRIFAEIVLQSVDKHSELRLRQDGFESGKEYAIRRYVDDVLIFAKDSKTAEVVHERYSDALREVNLTANAAKGTQSSRPFITAKSKSIMEVTKETMAFLGELFDLSSPALLPRMIWRYDRIATVFISRIKLLCLANGANYDDVASYVISTMTRQLVDVVEADGNTLSVDHRSEMHRAMLALLEILFFLYTVAPSVAASYNLGRALIVMIRFVRSRLPEWDTAVSERIISHVREFLGAACDSIHKIVGSHVALEAINLLLVCSELGPFYPIGEDLLTAIFIAPSEAPTEHNWSYFEFISCLHVMNSSPLYGTLRNRLLLALDKRMEKLEDVKKDSELAHLILDVSTCPFIEVGKRTLWLKRLCACLNMQAPDATEISAYFNEGKYWFVNWKDLDLLNVLQRKELSPAY